jgi:hypothetical protein
MEKQKVFCMECKKDLSDKTEKFDECECGSKNFIYGNTVEKTEQGFACSCGCSQFRMIAHVNMNPRYIKTFSCDKCSASVSTETYYESPYY